MTQHIPPTAYTFNTHSLIPAHGNKTNTNSHTQCNNRHRVWFTRHGYRNVFKLWRPCETLPFKVGDTHIRWQGLASPWWLDGLPWRWRCCSEQLNAIESSEGQSGYPKWVNLWSHPTHIGWVDLAENPYWVLHGLARQGNFVLMINHRYLYNTPSIMEPEMHAVSSLGWKLLISHNAQV